jgi:hypothetical protein
MKRTMTMLGAALLMGSTALTGASADTEVNPEAVSEIVVTADVQSIADPAAVAFWQSVEADLATALAAELYGRIAEDGALLSVDVDELSLVDAFAAPVGSERSRLTGNVILSDPENGETLQEFAVSASASEGTAPVAPGTAADGTQVIVLQPASAEFYAAAVGAFARGVAQTLQQ